MERTHKVFREHFSQQFLVSLDRPPRARVQRRATDAHVPAGREKLSRDKTHHRIKRPLKILPPAAPRSLLYLRKSQSRNLSTTENPPQAQRKPRRTRSRTRTKAETQNRQESSLATTKITPLPIQNQTSELKWRKRSSRTSKEIKRPCQQ